jgi:hypothetical protein
MEVDDIISYHDLVAEEKATLQKGMNFVFGRNYSVFLLRFDRRVRTHVENLRFDARADIYLAAVHVPKLCA